MKAISVYSLFLIVLSAEQLRAQGRTWTCVEKKFCVQTDTSSKIAGGPNTRHSTQELCRLVCGPWRGLWPQPSGQAKFSFHYVPINIKTVSFDLSLIPEAARPLADTFTTLARKKLSDTSIVFSSSNDVDEDSFQDNLLNLNVTIIVSSELTTFDFNTNEEYSVTVKNSDGAVTVKISAHSVFGARHALETLHQLTANLPNSVHRAIISSAFVEDRPIYAYRGLLIDTSRNFVPLTTIRQTLDAMAASKLNYFHWHATDAQSFPLEIPSVPYLSRYGAYSPEKVYKMSDVQGIVQYARERGIEVILEIDSPAHASLGWQEWSKELGYGNLAVCINKQPWREFCVQPPCGQLNPVNPNVTVFMKEIYKHIAATGFSGPFHMGGDEVHMGCWNSTAEIVDGMKARGLPQTKEGFLQLWSNFQHELLNVWDSVTNNPKKVIYWTSELTEINHVANYLPKERYIIQTWVPRDNPIVSQLLEKGYQVIISTKDAWYLDHGFWGTTKYYSWRNVYGNKILAEPGVLGGEGCMWGEFVDENSIHARIWPRAAALAERLWSDPISADYNEIETRLNHHRKRLLELGVTADALKPEWCLINEGECYNYNFYGRKD